VLVSKEYRAMTLHCVLQTNSQYCGGSTPGDNKLAQTRADIALPTKVSTSSGLSSCAIVLAIYGRASYRQC